MTTTADDIRQLVEFALGIRKRSSSSVEIVELRKCRHCMRVRIEPTHEVNDDGSTSDIRRHEFVYMPLHGQCSKCGQTNEGHRQALVVMGGECCP